MEERIRLAEQQIYILQGVGIQEGGEGGGGEDTSSRAADIYTTGGTVVT